MAPPKLFSGVTSMSGILLVRDIMTRNVKTVRTNDTVLDVVRKMNRFRIGSLIVTNNGRPIGIITQRDILEKIVEQRLDPEAVLARHIMSSPLVTIDPNSPVEEAARMMVERQIKRLIVVEDERLIGIVSSTDIMRASPTHIGILEELLRVE
jgi:CBS domain-containing protein